MQRRASGALASCFASTSRTQVWPGSPGVVASDSAPAPRRGAALESAAQRDALTRIAAASKPAWSSSVSSLLSIDGELVEGALGGAGGGRLGVDGAAEARAPEGDRAPQAGAAHRDAILQVRGQLRGVDAVEDGDAPFVERGAIVHRERRVDALRPRQREDGARLLQRLGGAREDAPEGVAVVADLHPAVALEAREVDAVAARDLEVRGERRLGRLVRRVAGRDALREPVGEGAERVEGLDAGRAAQRFGRRGLRDRRRSGRCRAPRCPRTGA